jgi:hypothetical protein
MWDRTQSPGRAPLPVFLKRRRSLGALQLIRRCQPFQSTQPPIFSHRNDDSHFATQMDHFMRASSPRLSGLRGHGDNATRPCRRPEVMLGLWRDCVHGGPAAITRAGLWPVPSQAAMLAGRPGQGRAAGTIPHRRRPSGVRTGRGCHPSRSTAMACPTRFPGFPAGRSAADASSRHRDRTRTRTAHRAAAAIA